MILLILEIFLRFSRRRRSIFIFAFYDWKRRRNCSVIMHYNSFIRSESFASVHAGIENDRRRQSHLTLRDASRKKKGTLIFVMLSTRRFPPSVSKKYVLCIIRTVHSACRVGIAVTSIALKQEMKNKNCGAPLYVFFSIIIFYTITLPNFVLLTRSVW